MGAFADEAINRAFGKIVNELRLEALKAKEPVDRRVLLRKVTDLAEQLAEGQRGRELAGDVATPLELEADDDAFAFEEEEIEQAPIESAELRAAALRLAGAWNARIEGEIVVFHVEPPRRSVVGNGRVGGTMVEPVLVKHAR